MGIYFSVDSPKIGKREINRGEDAPPVNKDGIMIICDGTGATGQAEHVIDAEVYTSAYLGARETSKIAEKFLTENYERVLCAFSDIDSLHEMVTELGQTIRTGLNEYALKHNLTLSIYGKSFKLLPTTFTAVVYKTYETRTDVVVLCAGDSKALWWDADGLHQLSVEDSQSNDISAGDCNISNCISADGNFQIAYSCYTLGPKGILLATSDGFTDPIKPFDQERYLIEWLGNFEELCQENSHELSAEITKKMDAIGFTRRDDCSIAGVILGYSPEEMREDFMARYMPKLIEAYIKPYKDLNNQYKNAEDDLYNAKGTLLKCECQIVKVIKEGIISFLGRQTDTDNLHNEPTFQFLTQVDAIGYEIRAAENRIENEKQEMLARCQRKESKLRDDYLEFLKVLCREHGSIRFSDEVIEMVRKYDENKSKLQEHYQGINAELSMLKDLPELNDENCNSAVLDNIQARANGFLAAIDAARDDYEAGEKLEQAINQYFSFENEEIEQFYSKDIENRFSILRGISKFPLFVSKKQGELKNVCGNLLEDYDTMVEMKNETVDENIQSKKNDAFIGVIKRHCGEIAQELFSADRYWEFLPDKWEKIDIPELRNYAEIKAESESLLNQREGLLKDYNNQYEKYLLNVLIQGEALFEKGV